VRSTGRGVYKKEILFSLYTPHRRYASASPSRGEALFIQQRPLKKGALCKAGGGFLRGSNSLLCYFSSSEENESLKARSTSSAVGLATV